MSFFLIKTGKGAKLRQVVLKKRIAYKCSHTPPKKFLMVMFLVPGGEQVYIHRAFLKQVYKFNASHVR